MTGSTRSSEGLDVRRRRIMYQAWHRGTREMDLLMGRFADALIDQFSEQEIDEFEHLIDAPDRELFSWISGTEETPADYDSGLFRRLKNYHLSGQGIIPR